MTGLSTGLTRSRQKQALFIDEVHPWMARANFAQHAVDGVRAGSDFPQNLTSPARPASATATPTAIVTLWTSWPTNALNSDTVRQPFA
jgi:hypothetical protein